MSSVLWGARLKTLEVAAGPLAAEALVLSTMRAFGSVRGHGIQ
jgi:hypothetical protein